MLLNPCFLSIQEAQDQAWEILFDYLVGTRQD